MGAGGKTTSDRRESEKVSQKSSLNLDVKEKEKSVNKKGMSMMP